MTESTTEIAQKEFSVIRDLLLVPLKPDLRNEELPSHRKWRSGCIPVGLPDLVPVKPPSDREGLEGFCNLREGEEGEKLLVVTVENRGNATAPQSTTRVTFVDRRNSQPDPGRRRRTASAGIGAGWHRSLRGQARHRRHGLVQLQPQKAGNIT